MDTQQVRTLAPGETFTARRAVELGLVDELGDLDRAIDLAAEMAHVKRRVWYFRPRRPLAQRLLDRLVRAAVRSAADEIEQWGPEIRD